MAVKNAVRILTRRFGIVWGIMFFILIYLVILLSLSLFFVLPIVRAMREAGVVERINEFFDLMYHSELTLKNISDKAGEVFASVREVYLDDSGVKVNLLLLVTLVLTLLNKFLVGFYEIATCEVLRDKMSYNAKTSFFSRFVANIPRSATFILHKMVYVILFDAIIGGAVFGLFSLCKLNAVAILFFPFLLIVLFVLLSAVRYSLISGWAAAVVVDGETTFAAFKRSLGLCKRNFGKVFSSYVIAWTVIVVVNLLCGLITFGAALVITVPATMAFLTALNLTVYYNNTDRKYYIDDENIR